MRRLVAAVAVALVSALTLTACGSDDSTSADGSAEPVKKISITFNGEDADPERLRRSTSRSASRSSST